MDFNELMDLASTKQQDTKKKKKNRKVEGSGAVSNEAVNSFLARKSAVKAKQKEQEVEAKRARIQARLEQEKLEKLNKRQKPTSANNFNNSTGRLSSEGRPPDITLHLSGEKRRFAHDAGRRLDHAEKEKITRNLLHGKVDEEAGKRKSQTKLSSQEENSEEVKQKDDQDKQSGSKNRTQKLNKGQIKRDEKETRVKSKQKSKNEHFEGPKRSNKNEMRTKISETESKQNDSHDSPRPQKKKLKRPHPPALSFQQLMDVATRQAENPDAFQDPLIANREPKQVPQKQKLIKDIVPDYEAKTKLKNKKSLNSNKTLATASKTARDFPGKEKSQIISKKKDSGNTAPSSRTPMLSQKPKPEIRQAPPKKMTIERETISEKRRGVTPDKFAHAQSKRRRRDEEEMDDFIDDTEDAEDVSSYIKQIFGYDKTRYKDKEDDIRGMESSFADIQREETKSARIGKLEDEIERLKEQRYESEKKIRNIKR